MVKEKVILVTGVANEWGGRLAAELLARSRMRMADATAVSEHDGANPYHVIGVDVEPLEEDIEGLDFIQVDIRNPSLPELLKSENVDTVCHLNFKHSYHRSEQAFDFNVLGTMKVLGACNDAGVKKVVMKSSTSVYGAHPGNPAFLTEKHPLRGSKNYGYTRDLVEIASFCSGYCSQPTEMLLTILRFPNIIGTTVDTPMVRYLSKRPVPVLLGFDPMMQIVHESDVIESLVIAVENERPGIFNVAAEGALPLRRIIGLAGRIPVPIFHPFAYIASDVVSTARLPIDRAAPIEWDYLRYPWVADVTNMRTEMHFEPKYTAEETLREFKRHQKLSRYDDDRSTVTGDEDYLREIIKLRSELKVRELNSREDAQYE